MKNSDMFDREKLRDDLIVVRGINLNATVPVLSTVMAEVDFYQARIGERLGVPIAGMLGMDFLQQFDMDFDQKAGVLRLWPSRDGLKDFRAETRARLMQVIGCASGGIKAVRAAQCH